VTHSGLLRSGDLVLRRAEAGDLEPLVALQRGAYARNRTLLGVEPIPLQADYAAIMRDMEVWLAEKDGRLAGALILEPRTGDLLIWSISSDPAGQGGGLGRSLLAAAEERARELGRTVVRLYTGTLLGHLVAWYGRHGFAVERVEVLSDRSITHMIKHLGCEHGEEGGAGQGQGASGNAANGTGL
jgi:GNAT superfamily N-acetyltransferase